MEAARGGRQPALLDDRDERGEFAEFHVYGRKERVTDPAIRRAYRRSRPRCGSQLKMTCDGDPLS
jgi:hypothetical protein